MDAVAQKYFIPFFLNHLGPNESVQRVVTKMFFYR